MHARLLKRSLIATFATSLVAFSLAATPAQAAGTKYPLTLKYGGFTTKLAKKPTKIISLSPSGTEILFAIGAGPQVFAVDSLSNFPKNAPLDKSISAFTPSVEALAAKNPDLVLLQADAQSAQAVRNGLTKLGIPVFVEPAPKNLNDVYKEIKAVGIVTNHTIKASALVKSMRTSIQRTISSSKNGKGVKFYHELDETYYTATSDTFIGKVYKDFGLVNIGDAAAKSDDAGYPKLSAEYIVTSDPKVIFLGDAQYGTSATSVAARAGWSDISAVKNGNIVSLPADIPSRWGPRLTNFYTFIANELAKTK